MGIVLMLVLPLLIGWFVRPRLTAFVAYFAAYAFVFTLQSTMLVIEWVGGDEKAFGSYPKAPADEVWSYGLVNLGLLAVGIGLLWSASIVAGRLRSRRRVAGPVAGQPV